MPSESSLRTGNKVISTDYTDTPEYAQPRFGPDAVIPRVVVRVAQSPAHDLARLFDEVAEGLVRIDRGEFFFCQLYNLPFLVSLSQRVLRRQQQTSELRFDIPIQLPALLLELRRGLFLREPLLLRSLFVEDALADLFLARPAWFRLDLGCLDCAAVCYSFLLF